ncbi:peroxisomal coenzyme A diphosphatase NUDT7 isoform X1 [Amblyraja radiata]|uniref:peroxisomal coenzyme A diphosphatase NUDT7 isoform X1 n=1 Tax=Amblyraja radiata TaxID=386614 RepID=UPI001401D3B2|nr:peroxisomal coenzyme A diphosphatase NUDT7 isoform X1 [Amblyraja radiata]XP_032891748.1 peroxisomal coenzyme A diphosphatase NUDT7 isoform X1 [Amblyraja radiata]
MADSRISIKDKAKYALKAHDIGNKYSDLALPRASVLVPLLVKNNELHVLLTVRSMQLHSNQGEVCFPGGKHDSKDRSDIDTALREAHEEIGLPPVQVEVICKMVPIINKDDILVTPVVAFISDTFQPRPNANEVSDVFIVPMRHFLKSEEHTSTPYETGMLVHFFTFKDRQTLKSFTVWGLTAQICIIVGYLALGQNPSFKVDFDLDNPSISMDKCLLTKYATSKL